LQVKNELFADTEVTDNNKISIVRSNLDGNKVLVGISSTTFTFNGKLDSGLKDNLINQLDGSFGYYTSSKNDKGGIEKIKITTGGIAYKNLPKIIGVDSDEGNGSILLPQSKSIGKINSYKILDIGYDYPSDITLKPYVKLPTTLRLEPLSTIDSIEVIFPGLNYTTSPDLVLIDGFTNKIIEDLNLKYDLNKRFVTIVSNSKGIYNLPPKVIATNNTNGLSIKSIEYDDSTKIVRALLKKEFSDQSTFPFSVGDDILVEGVSVVPTLNQNIEQKGYNSKSYNYSMFKITKIQPAQGFGNAYIEYSLNDYLEQNQTAGTFDPENSSGIITPQKYLPRFNVTLRKNSFHIGEEVIGNEGSIGEVLRFDKNNEYIFVKSTTSFANETFIIGQSSKSQAVIKDSISPTSFADVGSSSVISDGWMDEVGFLNNYSQRTHDGDYYQYFSYSLKSEVPFEKWNDAVSNLNHTLGFKKFSELNVLSSPEIPSDIPSEQNEGSFSAICQLNSTIDVDCIHDFDLVSENNFYIDETLTSDEMVFNSTILIDYFESIGNRVLTIDDISNEFTNLVSKTYVTSFTI